MLQVGLLVAALRDLRRRPSAEVNGSKTIWAGVSFVNFLVPLAYVVFGRER
jgi:Phospholipase_D-nuclease N-terminal